MNRAQSLGIVSVLCLSLHPEVARSCPRGSSGASSGSSGSGRSGGSSGGSFFGGGSYARSRSNGQGSGFSWRLPDFLPMELSVTASARSLNLSETRVSGWDEHPLLENYVYGERNVPGARMGLARANFGGATVRWNVLLGGRMTLGLQGGLYSQSNENPAAPESDGQLSARRGLLYEVGADLGGIVPLGPVTFRAGAFAGYRGLEFQLHGIGTAGCTTIPVVRNDTVVIAPRVQVDVNFTRNFSLGLLASMDVLSLDDMQAGVSLAWHARGYSGR